MEFNAFHKSYFSAYIGAFSKVTEREFIDSQVTLTGLEADIVIDHFGEENIQLGKVQNDKEKSLKKFLLYPDLKPLSLNVIFPKPPKRELRLYLSSAKGFKPRSNDILFIYKSLEKELIIGSCTEEFWNALNQKENELTSIGKDESLKNMNITVFNIANDKVIDSYVGLGQSNYRFALDEVYPLANRFSAQRKVLQSKFYERLERDILKDCLMPPITLAFVEKGVNFNSIAQLSTYVNQNISKGYILDGLQRLNTLYRASMKTGFNFNKEIFYNVIVAENTDKLLYRMITLNNGQKGMTPRHQIEILTQELFDFNGSTINVQSEKEKSESPIKDAYSLGDISKGYLAFLTSNVHNENTKIIEEKMDQILVDRILDTDLDSNNLQFTDVIKFLDKVNENEIIRVWLQVANNFIGFCVGIKKSHEYIFNLSLEDVQTALQNFEFAFKIVNPSKINVGKYRRELSNYFIKNAEELFTRNADYISDKFVDLTVSE